MYTITAQYPIMICELYHQYHAQNVYHAKDALTRNLLVYCHLATFRMVLKRSWRSMSVAALFWSSDQEFCCILNYAYSIEGTNNCNVSFSLFRLSLWTTEHHLLQARIRWKSLAKVVHTENWWIEVATLCVRSDLVMWWRLRLHRNEVTTNIIIKQLLYNGKHSRCTIANQRSAAPSTAQYETTGSYASKKQPIFLSLSHLRLKLYDINLCALYPFGSDDTIVCDISIFKTKVLCCCSAEKLWIPIGIFPLNSLSVSSASPTHFSDIEPFRA